MIDNFQSAASPDTFFAKLELAFDHPLETDRLIIKPWKKSEAVQIARLFNVDGRAFAAHLEWDTDFEYEPDYIEDTVFDHFEAESRRLEHFCPFIYKKATGEIIGRMIFSQDDELRNRLSYYITPSERSKGYAQEAHAACLELIRQKRLFQNLHAQVRPENIPSRRLLTANGFSETGTEFCESEKAMVIAYDIKLYPEASAPQVQGPVSHPQP